MFNSLSIPSTIRNLGKGTPIIVAVLALSLGSLQVRAQSVPVPFAGLFAGGATTFCSGSLPVVGTSTPARNFGDGCPATQSAINVPIGVATDSFGNVFIGDQTDMLVRVVYNGGTALAAALAAANVQNPGLIPVKGNIYTIAGGYTSTSGLTCQQKTGTTPVGSNSGLDGCPATESEQAPRGIAVDSDGNIFIASVTPTSQIRIVYVGGVKAAALITLENPTITSPQVGYVYNIAGGNSSAYGGDGALASKANLNTPRGIWVDANENIYFADEFNNAVRFVSSTTGFISTVAGHNAGSVSSCSAVAPTGDGSSATATTASLACPYGLVLDQYGNIFIAEAGTGTTTVPGRVRVVYEGGTLPGISSPTPGNIYTYAGAAPTSGGTATTGAQLTTFQEVFGISIDPEGYLYITDFRTGSTGSNHLWRVDPTNGNIAAIAGNGTSALTAGAYCNGLATGPVAIDKYGDGCPATQAFLNTPQEALGFTANGTFYVADRANNLVRSFTYNNSFATTTVGSSVTQPLAFLYAAGSLPIAENFTTQGSTPADYSDAGGDTCALNTTLAAATTCVDYVKFAPAAAGQRPGSVTVSSATATIGSQTLSGVGIAPVLTISLPTAVTLGSSIQPLSISTDAVGNVNISDGKAKQVLRTTIAGGTPTAYITGLGQPRQTATDAYGNVYVADSVNNTIVEHTTAGTTVTLGSGLSAPQGVAADVLGNVYAADTGNNRLVYISPITGSQHIVTLSGYTLSAPTYLAMDTSDDLFIIDTNNTRVIEVPLGKLPQLVTLPTGVQPVAIAFDPGGNTYIADNVSGNILFVPAGATTATALITGLTTPAGVAVDPTGNVFVADSSATSAAGYNFAVNASTFTTTNIGLTSLPITLTVGSIGNLSATLATPAYTETGSSSAFPPSGTATCVGGLVLPSDSTCTQTFVFSPTTPGAQTAKVVFNSTTGQTVTANFSAFATNLILTTTTIAPSGTGPINYGQTATYTVTLTPASNGSAAPTGTISFVVDGKTIASKIVSSNPYTFSFSPTVGTHSVAATYSGDPIYAGSNTSTFLTVGKAVTTTTASYSQSASGFTLTAVMTPASIGASTFTGNVNFYVDGSVASSVAVGNGTVSTTVLVADGAHTYYAMYAGDSNYAASTSTTQSFTVSRTPTTITLAITPVSPNGVAGLQLNAKLASSGTGAPSGIITFTNGGTTLGTANLSTAVNGVVSITTSTTTYASYVFTASYSGDGLFEPATATATEGPDFVVVTSPVALPVPQGGQALQSITVSPINGYSGTLTAACSNLPVNSVCRFQPIPLPVATTASSTITVQVYVGVNPNVADAASLHLGKISQTMLALLLLVPGIFAVRRKENKRGLPWLFSIVVLVMLAFAPLGCGIKTPADSTVAYITPIGTYAVTVTLTDTNNVARSAVFNVTVNTQ